MNTYFCFCNLKMCRKQCINSKSRRAFLFFFQNEQVKVHNDIAYSGVVHGVCFCWSNPHTTQILPSRFRNPLSNDKETWKRICYSSMQGMGEKQLIYAFQKSFFEFNAHTSSHAKKIFLNSCKEKMLCSINIIWLYFQEFFNNFHRNLNFLRCSNFLYELRFKLQRVGRL